MEAARLPNKIARFFLFVLLGLATAAVGEFQFFVFIRSDYQNFFGSIFFNSLYLSVAAILSALILRLLRDGPTVLLLHLFLFGGSGLMIEWSLIGNSPWGNPAASRLACSPIGRAWRWCPSCAFTLVRSSKA